MENQTIHPDNLLSMSVTGSIFTEVKQAMNNDFVEDINYSQSMLMLPVTVFMVILMLVGFCGNTVVVVVFVTKQNKSIANYFMLSLAAIDLISCTLLHPYVIYKLFHFYDSLHAETCKVFEFLIHTGLAVQTLVLLSVAIDRYCAVCRPLTFVTSYNRAILLIVSSIVTGTAASIPLLVFYGNKTISLEFAISTAKESINNSTTLKMDTFNRAEPVTMGISTAVTMAIETTVLFDHSFPDDGQLVYNPEGTIKYLKEVHICHYSDRYDGTLSQSIFGMCMFFTIAFVTTTISVLYTLVLRTIICRQRRVQPNGLVSDPFGSDSRRSQDTEKKMNGQVQGQHQGTRSNQTKTSPVQASVNGKSDGRGSDINGFEHFNVVDTHNNTKSGVNGKKKALIKRTLNNKADPLNKDVLENNKDQEQHETSLNNPKIVSSCHGSSQKGIKNRSSLHCSSKSNINNRIETKNITSKNKNTTEKRTDKMETSNAVNWTCAISTKFLTDATRATRRKSSNVSSISNSDVEVTRRSLRMPTGQTIRDKVDVSSSRQLPKTVTFNDENVDSNRQDHLPSSSQQINVNQRQGVVKGVKVLSLVTVVFIICWLPFLVLRIMATINPDVWADNIIAGNVFFNLLSHFFFLNNAVNPLIYTFVNSNFRQDCRNLFKKTKNKIIEMCASGR